MATAAAGGLGVAAATAADAQAATGQVHACYNKSTHALKYSKKASCAKGSKLVSWQKSGPRGAQGANGAQGPQGAQGTPGGGPGYADTHLRFPLDSMASPPIKLTGSSGTVASFTPASAGDFAVNAFADVETSGPLWCGVRAGTRSGDSTAVGLTTVAARLQDVKTTGIVYASPGAPVYEYCRALGDASVFSTAVTGVHLTAGHTSMAGKHGQSSRAVTRQEWRAMSNRFQKRAK